MDQLHIINTQQNMQMLDEIYKLRHQSFNERLGWEVKSVNGREFDQFDHSGTQYVALTDHNEELLGCWRALPTQGDYMLKNVFPELLQGEVLPQKDDIWEISRFTVNTQNGKNRNQLVSALCAKLVKSFYDFALENNIRSYVAVTTVACERMLKNLGVTIRRLGDGQALQIGIEKTVAVAIDVNESLNIRIA